MNYLHIILLLIFFISLILDYLSFNSRKTALQLVNDMGIGYNLGNTYNCCDILEEKDSGNEEIKLWGATFPTKNTLKEIRKNGFKTIRFQILYTNYIYNNDKINFEWINKIKELINSINKLNMYLILAIKHTREFWDSEGKNSENKYNHFWSQIANELISYDEHLIFESIYEIGYLIYLGIYNDEDEDYYLSQDFINIIRNSGGLNIKRLLIIPMISSDYELELYSLNNNEYKIPKDPYNKLAISLYYYFPSEDLNTLEPIMLFNKQGFANEIYPFTEWGSSKNYKDIKRNLDFMQRNFVDKGIPVIIGEVGILNEYIKKNINSIEQFLYTLFSMSSEYEGFLPCLWDIPVTSSIYKNYYFNKENNKWSDDKYGKIFNKISKGKFIKSFDYYYPTNLETEYFSLFGLYSIYPGSKKIVKIYINARFKIHTENDTAILAISQDKDFNDIFFYFTEKDGKKQYDGTSIFVVDASDSGLYYYVQAINLYEEEYIIINNITVQYEEIYLQFDYISYKSDILNEINN